MHTHTHKDINVTGKRKGSSVRRRDVRGGKYNQNIYIYENTIKPIVKYSYIYYISIYIQKSLKQEMVSLLVTST